MLYWRFSMNHVKDFRISNCQLLQAVLMMIECLYDHTMIIFCSFSLSIEKNSRPSTSFYICFGISCEITRIVLRKTIFDYSGRLPVTKWPLPVVERSLPVVKITLICFGITYFQFILFSVYHFRFHFGIFSTLLFR